MRVYFPSILVFEVFFHRQPMESAHYWYYVLELGFYLSLLLRISVDIKRKVNLDARPLSSKSLFRETKNKKMTEILVCVFSTRILKSK